MFKRDNKILLNFAFQCITDNSPMKDFPLVHLNLFKGITLGKMAGTMAIFAAETWRITDETAMGGRNNKTQAQNML